MKRSLFVRNIILIITQQTVRRDESEEIRLKIYQLFEDIFDDDELNLFCQIATLKHTKNTELQYKYAVKLALDYLKRQNKLAYKCDLEQITNQQQNHHNAQHVGINESTTNNFHTSQYQVPTPPNSCQMENINTKIPSNNE